MCPIAVVASAATPVHGVEGGARQGEGGASNKSEAHGHGHGHSHGGPAGPVDFEQREAVSRAWVFLVAMSLHSVFDGLSVGAQSSFAEFYSILGAVVRNILLHIILSRSHPYTYPHTCLYVRADCPQDI
jgi:zinc transporter ZupT